MKEMLKRAARKFGYEFRRRPKYDWLEPLDLLDRLRGEHGGELEIFLRYACANFPRSHAQLFQDLFVLAMTDEKRGGYFVEFGAADGKFLSNSFLLEKEFGWQGIVGEPSHNWHGELRQNRKCDIDIRCIWDASGETVQFLETNDAAYSTISAFKAKDYHDRSHSKEYDVETVSLNDLLDQHEAPREMDYLSIDTEGSELTILKSFDFKERKFRIITVEHNYVRPERDDIFSLLSSHGYERVFGSITKWDDWYINRR
jgi:FkbM family methyltransferase